MAYKKTSALKPLKSTLETITAMDFRKSPGDVFDAVQFGRTFVITKQGKAIAVLSPLPGESLTIVVDSKGKESYKL